MTRLERVILRILDYLECIKCQHSLCTTLSGHGTVQIGKKEKKGTFAPQCSLMGEVLEKQEAWGFVYVGLTNQPRPHIGDVAGELRCQMLLTSAE